MAARQNSIISAAETAALFRDLESLPALLLAVSGGPDSTALMLLAARWRTALGEGPTLVAATVDHGLRAEAAAEARAVAKFARTLGMAHRTLRWTGRKPATGLQEAARAARYRLLVKAARASGASAILTAHTLDDQAETVLFRMIRGSGLTGLAGMRSVAAVPGLERGVRSRTPDQSAELGSGLRISSPAAAPRNGEVLLVRPLLSIPKSRLTATLRAENVPFADDPSNRDPRFTRARLRTLTPALAAEGLDPPRLALLAQRLARADAALDRTAKRTYETLAKHEKTGRIVLPRADFMAIPDEIRIRLLGRAIAAAGDEGPVELGKLEALAAALAEAHCDPNGRFRRSLAGAVVTLKPEKVTVERAPPRRARGLTARKGGRRKMGPRR